MNRTDPKATVDPAGMRQRNSGHLLRIIWERQEISRAALARATGMSPSTVSAIVSELEQAGLVRFARAGASTGGRRPQLVSFRDEVFVLLGVELGASHVEVAALDFRGHVLAHQTRTTPTQHDPAASLQTIEELSRLCLAADGVRSRRLVGIGVAAPSPIDPSRAGQLSPLILPKWRGVDLHQEIHDQFQVPVFVENDANAGAVAEQWWGAGTDGADLTYIKLGTGIGAGHIISGQLHRGAGGTAGEIGHFAIDPNGPLCACGNRGCLTTLIGTPALFTRARERGIEGDGDPLRVDHVIDSARTGELAAVRLFDAVGEDLGLAVAGMLNLLNPSTVVIGGELARAGELLLGPLRAAVTGRALFSSIADTRIVATELGSRAIAVGAATLVLREALEDRTLFPNAVSTS